ncbi:MAG: tRNA methyl transferase PRC-barrel domain-containing protein, partial [Actinomycetaceae bacterium]
GEIVDTDGRVLGEHAGAYAYTVGQRKGLGLNRPAADGRPRYVLDVDTRTRRVVVGPSELLSTRRIGARDVIWLASDEDAAIPTEVTVQIRAHGEAHPGVVTRTTDADGERLDIELREPVRGVAAGQSAVVYLGDRVLGQATIASRG